MKNHSWPVIVTSLVAIVSAACASSDPPRAGGGSATDAASQSLAEDADTIPCEPRAVLVAVCQRCHSRPPLNGAPFPLVTRSNIVRVGSTGEVRRLMIDQLEARRMPLFPVTIEEGQRTVLLEWLRAGAPAVSPRSCIDAGATDAASAAATATEDVADAGPPPADADVPETDVVDACDEPPEPSP